MRSIITMLLFVSIAHAEDAEIKGTGTVSCAEFAQFYEVNPARVENEFFDWAQGFMSAFNVPAMVQFKQFRDLAAATIEDQKNYIRSYCNREPLTDYMTAVVDP